MLLQFEVNQIPTSLVYIVFTYIATCIIQILTQRSITLSCSLVQHVIDIIMHGRAFPPP